MLADLVSSQWPVHPEDLMTSHTISQFLSESQTEASSGAMSIQSYRQMYVRESCYVRSVDTWGSRLSPAP